MKVLPRQVTCRTLFEAQGLSRSGAAAMVGNFCVESGSSLPSAFRTRDLDHGSNGLAQWRLGRLTAYRLFVRTLKPELIEEGMSEAEVEKALWPWYGRMDFQVRFAVTELKTDYPELHARLVAGGDVAVLATDVCWQYERPNKALSHIADRIAWAQAIATAGPAPAASVQVVPGAVTVVDHLHAAAADHTKKAGVGAATAGAAAVAGIGLIFSNFVHAVPAWELAVLAGLILVAAAGVMGAVVQARSAANIKVAALGVSKVPAPADSAKPSLKPAVQAAIEQETSSAPEAPSAPAGTETMTVAPIGPSLVGSPGGVTMTIGRPA